MPCSSAHAGYCGMTFLTMARLLRGPVMSTPLDAFFDLPPSEPVLTDSSSVRAALGIPWSPLPLPEPLPPERLTNPGDPARFDSDCPACAPTGAFPEPPVPERGMFAEAPEPNDGASIGEEPP